ncbi:MAG: hypothetical protein JSU57_01050 [Candidatus Heimdallarchaeota archaeon]|nr:MAG: hypothetical protein JSU57_01050 [Candidatus Heimdallarchaeota archaeon]
MTKKTKIIFFCVIWFFSAFCAIVGTIFIATAVILPQTPYDISPSPIVGEIRQEMGPFQNLAYYNPETDEFFWDVTVEVTVEEGIETFLLYDENEREIGPLNPWFLEEIHTNGTIFYNPDMGGLIFALFNGTFYGVNANPEHIKLDISRQRLTLNYQPGKDFPIHRTTFEFTETTEEEQKKSEIIGNYFIVKNRGWFAWFQQILQALWLYSWDAFILIGRNILITVAIGGGAGIITAFILIVTRLSKLFGGKFLTFTILKALHGKVGKILSYIPIFDFIGDFFVDERLIDVINFSGIQPTLSELYRQRWYDILVFPTALASILTIFFVQYYPGDKIQALVWSPVLTPIVLVLILIYYPLIFALNEGGFKRLRLSPQGDIVSVKPLGNVLRDGLGIVIGFSGILSLGALAYEINTSAARQASTTGQIQIAGFSLDIFSILLLVLWTLGLFFILLGSSFVGASILAVNYLQSSHLDTIEYLRTKSEEKGVVTNWGSVNYQFSPVATKAIFERT